MFLTVATLLAGIGLTRLRFEDDPRAIFRATGPEFARLNEFYAAFGADDQDVILVIEGADLFSRRSIAALREVYQRLDKVNGVASVVGLFDVRKPGPIPLPLIPGPGADDERLSLARADALRNPAALGHFLSADGKVTLMAVRLEGANLELSRLRPLLDEIQAVARKSFEPAGLTYLLAGHPPIRIDLNQTLRDEVLKFAALSALISACIAWLIYRSLAAVIISVAGPSVGVVWTLGLLGWLGLAIDPLSVILPTLLFVVGFTDSVHFVSEMGHARLHTPDPLSAAAQAVEQIGPACLLTALTTMAGFGSLVVAESESIQRFGLTCAAGAAVLFMSVQTVAPLLASSRLGGRLKPSRHGTGKTTLFLRPLLRPYAAMLRRPRLVASASVLFTVACFLISLQLRADQLWTESLPEQSDSVRVTRISNDAFGGAMFGYVVIEWPEGLTLETEETLDALLAVHAACEDLPPLSRPFSIINLLQSFQPQDEEIYDQTRRLRRAPEGMLNQLVAPAMRKAVVSVRVPDVGAAQLAPAFSQLEERLKRLEQQFPDFRFHLTGTVVVAARSIYQMIGDLARSLTLAGFLIFILMTWVFRSWRLGLLSIVPNIFPQAITATLLVLTDQALTMTSVMTFSLCLGLSVDDTVHFLMRYKNERRRRGVRSSLLETFSAVGGVMITTSLVLIGGFLAMSLSQMPSVRMFAWLSCATLTAALLGDLVMLPSLLAWRSGEGLRRRAKRLRNLRGAAVRP